MAQQDKITTRGPKTDGIYLVEFRTAEGDAIAISIPGNEAAVIRHFQERMPYGLFVPDVSVREPLAPPDVSKRCP
jgi:hypothetical protein